MKKLIKNTIKCTVAGLVMSSSLAVANDYLQGKLEIGPFLAANPDTHSYVGPLDMTDHYYFHQFGSYPDIGYFLESPVGLINDNETQMLSFEISTSNLFADPTMHLVLSMAGDSFVRTNNNNEIINISDVQLSGRGPALGILSRFECTPNAQVVEAFGIEDYTRNRNHGNLNNPAFSTCDVGEEFQNNTTYRIDIHANKNWVAYWIFREQNIPSLNHWVLEYSSSAYTPEQSLDHYFGNIIIGTASRSINSSINLDNVYVAKFGADYTSKPEISALVNACANRYCMTIRGQNFDTDSEVWIRKKKLNRHSLDPNITPQPNEFTKLIGTDVYARKYFPTVDTLFFPIQDLDLQQAWIDDGLCFSVKNSDTFSNEECHQRVLNPVQPKFMGKQVESYGSQDVEHTSWLVTGDASPLEGGNTLKIMGNSWKKINYNYNVTANTVLTVKFKSNQQEPEINSIGLRQSNGSVTYFQLYGTQNHSGAVQTYHNYQAPYFKSYSIPVGQYFTGGVTHMIFVADEDNHVGQRAVFQNPKLVN